MNSSIIAAAFQIKVASVFLTLALISISVPLGQASASESEPCPSPVHFSATPIVTEKIQRILTPAGSGVLYFLGSEPAEVFLPVSGRVLWLEANITIMNGRETLQYSIAIEPCSGALVQVRHLDELSDFLKPAFRGIQHENCKSFGQDSEPTTICRVTPAGTVYLRAGTSIGHVSQGLIALELSYDQKLANLTTPVDPLLIFAEPLRTTLAAKRSKPGSCSSAEDCRLVQGAWTNPVQ